MGGGWQVAREGHYPVECELYLPPSPPSRAKLLQLESGEGLLVGATVRPLHWQLALLSVYGCGGLWRHGVMAVGA